MDLRTKYQKEIKPELQNTLKTNIMSVPELKKIVINVGLGEALSDNKVLGRVAEQLQLITGQKPKTNRAKVSISSFKLRAGDMVGMMVTLRGKRMYDFLEKLTRIVLPRVRDFRGVKLTGFDGRGNYNLGLKEQIVFPEIEYDKIDKVRGMEITLVTNSSSDESAKLLLEKLGLPFEKHSR
jgi:large subunit ribosomal protein L5